MKIDTTDKSLRWQTAIGFAAVALTATINCLVSKLNWWLLVCVFVGALAVQMSIKPLLRWWCSLDSGRQHGVVFLCSGSLILAAIAIWFHALGPSLSQRFIDKDEVVATLRRYRWITYDPPDYNPLTGQCPTYLDIQRDLRQIADAGFTGIITFSSRASLSAIPAYAKRLELGVIMGVYDPGDRAELALAAAQKEWVDGYAVGHNNLHSGYSFAGLLDATCWLRFRTGRPVSTTERLESYFHEPRLLSLGDWVFPDVHLSLRSPDFGVAVAPFCADAPRDVATLVGYVKQIVELADKTHRPVMLKMVTYPVAGIKGASPQEQARFYLLLLDHRRDVTSPLPLNVSVALHSAFDLKWKTMWPFYPWEPYTGLLEADGTPRHAAAVAVECLP